MITYLRQDRDAELRIRNLCRFRARPLAEAADSSLAPPAS
jgi:hypothetical protein